MDGTKTAPRPRPAFGIQTADGLVPGRRYTTASAALRAARRKFKATQHEVHVMWINQAGVPKMCMAHVNADGVTRTRNWSDADG